MSPDAMYIFNPEHDLCLANADPNFVPKASAMRFGIDCPQVVRLICEGEIPPSGIAAWGWDMSLKRRLLRLGVSPECLPDDETLGEIRRLSHRRYAMEAFRFLQRNLQDTSLIESQAPLEISSIAKAEEFLRHNGQAVFKAPWSSSGKGIRWIDSRGLTTSDTGWLRNTIASQGSVMAEVRREPERDFAMLFHVSSEGVSFCGFSLFETSFGAYCGNVLASDGYILSEIGKYLPRTLILQVRDALKEYFSLTLTGKYCGYLGVDMYAFRHCGKSLLNPCVEINLRMTMGLLARRLFDKGIPAPHHDGSCMLSVVYAPDSATLHSRLKGAEHILTSPGKDSRYAIAIFRISN